MKWGDMKNIKYGQIFIPDNTKLYNLIAEHSSIDDIEALNENGELAIMPLIISDIPQIKYINIYEINNDDTKVLIGILLKVDVITKQFKDIRYDHEVVFLHRIPERLRIEILGDIIYSLAPTHAGKGD